MTGDQGVGLIWAAGWITLIGSSLVARAIPRGRLFRLAALWLAIFAICLLVVSIVAPGHRTSGSKLSDTTPSQDA